MQASDIPGRLPLPFAESGLRAAIPVASSAIPGRASLTDGFPSETMQPIGAGGIPPSGQDFNGILYEISAWARWVGAGGRVPYDAAFSTEIGGYPLGATVGSLTVPGRIWRSTADNNITDPDAGGAGWTPLLSGTLINAQVFTTSGTYTPTLGTASIVVEVLSGGGAGGGCPVAGSAASAGGGGGGGAYAHRRLFGIGVTAVTVGAGGTPFLGATGGSGGASSFGSHVTCPASTGGLGGNPVSAGNVSGNPGSGSAPTGGDFGFAGNYGGAGLALSALSAIGGAGGSSIYGSGGGPAGTTGTGVLSGVAGSGYGAGGGGASAVNNGLAANGGAGTAGLVIVWEYA